MHMVIEREKKEVRKLGEYVDTYICVYGDGWMDEFIYPDLSPWGICRLPPL
jgi:hypothetical protein